MQNCDYENYSFGGRREVKLSTIENPILTGFNPDPSICRAGDDYYIAVSTLNGFLV